MVSEVQAVLFDADYWNIFSSHLWLQKHGIYPKKSAHVTDNFIRYRINEPDKYSRMRTKQITPTIEFIIGYN